MSGTIIDKVCPFEEGKKVRSHLPPASTPRAMAEKYKLPNVLEIPTDKLFNPDGSNIQQHFFYNDEDGRASFTSFLAQYKNQPDWEIRSEKTYVHIVSKAGKRVEIFANLPEQEFDGITEIEKALQKRNIHTIMVAHRGHSYHANSTIERIPPIAKIVYLGSCGGYSNLDGVLQRAPEAHILSTKGTGTMHINDPLLKSLSEQIRNGQNISWADFWKKQEKKFGENPNFRNYIPPHRNLGVLFLKIYKNVLP